MAATDDYKTNDLLLALRHPLRRQILHMLNGDEPSSPRELADALNQPLSNVSYHVRILADCGAAKLVRTRQVRGSTQHFYRSSVKPEWARAVLRSTSRPKLRRAKRRQAGKKKL
jgi:DNA-binding transcriptional ArsR family regulator